MSPQTLATAACLVLSLCLQQVRAAPRIVTSIEPLRDLAAALTVGISQPESLIPGQASIHHFALRPSQLALLRDAELVIWIDRRFEAGFNRIESLLSAKSHPLELAPLLDLQPEDLHLWFSPRLLLASARAIAEALIALDPNNADRYRDNGGRLETAIAERSRMLRGHLRPDHPLLLTDHAFLDAFAEEFGFDAVIELHDHHEGGGSLGDLKQVEKRLAEHPATCLLTTGAVVSPLGDSLARKYRLEVVSLQPDDAPGQPLRHLDRLLDALQTCDFLR